MKNFDEILETIHSEKEEREELNGLTSESDVSVWRTFVYIVAIAIDGLRQMFSTHRTEIYNEIAEQKVHKATEIRNRLLGFQYGFELRNDEWVTGSATPQQIEESKIIKYAAVVESDDEKRVICKIATETGEELSPITQEQLESVAAFVKEIKPPGVPYTVINYLPDLLRLNIRIFRDPLILTANGLHRIDGIKPVEIALKEFMKELPFNGELKIQELANKLEKTAGVKLVHIDSAETAWLNAETANYGDYTAIDVRALPVSGYFKIIDFNGISYGV